MARLLQATYVLAFIMSLCAPLFAALRLLTRHRNSNAVYAFAATSLEKISSSAPIRTPHACASCTAI